jgi:hypothetical protein
MLHWIDFLQQIVRLWGILNITNTLTVSKQCALIILIKLRFVHKACESACKLCKILLLVQYRLWWKHERFWEFAWRRQLRCPIHVLEDDITMDLREELSWGIVRGLQVPQKVWNFLTRLAAVKFVIRTASWTYSWESYK